MDLGPMEPCPAHPKGRHALSGVLPEDSEHDITLFCGRCGALRRVPAAGAMSSSLDDRPASEITAAVFGTQGWESR